MIYYPSSPLLAKSSPQAACRPGPPAVNQRVCKAGNNMAGQAPGTHETTCLSAPRRQAVLGHIPSGWLGSQLATPGFSRQVANGMSGAWSNFCNCISMLWSQSH